MYDLKFMNIKTKDIHKINSCFVENLSYFIRLNEYFVLEHHSKNQCFRELQATKVIIT